MSQPRQRYEVIHLLVAIRKAIETGEAERDSVLHAQRLQRFAELDQEDWARIIANVPELALYQTVTEGIVATAQALHLPLPPIEDYTLEPLGGPRGGFSYVAADRSVRVLAFDTAQPAPYYAVDLFDVQHSYQGNAPSLVEVTRLVSEWLGRGIALSEVLPRYAWMRSEPVRATWRMRLGQGGAGDH